MPIARAEKFWRRLRDLANTFELSISATFNSSSLTLLTSLVRARTDARCARASRCRWTWLFFCNPSLRIWSIAPIAFEFVGKLLHRDLQVRRRLTKAAFHRGIGVVAHIVQLREIRLAGFRARITKGVLPD